jgi:glycerol transport system ATP-binding protein
MRLELAGVSKQVGAETWLYPLDFTLQESALTVLLGSTRAGKTSLMRIMAGLDEPSSGQVKVDGADVTRVPVRHRNIAMVYQQFINYPSMTVAVNIASPMRLRGQHDTQARVHEIARTLHIEEFLQRLPAELSGGQQQRLCIARGVAIKPEVLLLDEPCSALDPISTAKIEELIAELKDDYTVVIVTHNMQQAARCSDYTAYMYLGELMEFGPTDQIFVKPARKETEDYITGRFG